LTLRRVPRGTSGAVSPLGLLATALGGAVIGAVLALADGAARGPSARTLLLSGLVLGVLGSLADSVLGATVQAGYRCAHCAVETEGPLHHCGRASAQTRGFAWFDNDMVNLTATALGAALGAAWLASGL
jgi:uncharacterized membrane protein